MGAVLYNLVNVFSFLLAVYIFHLYVTQDFTYTCVIVLLTDEAFSVR